MNVTALTVARVDPRRSFSDLSTACLSGRLFQRASDVRDAWFDAVNLVETTHFFFLDDDDELPEDYASVLKDCLSENVAVAYTDELINERVWKQEPYSQETHLRQPGLIHHLALCRTEIAREAIRRLPRGDFWPEMLLFWEMAKIGGASYVPRIGYRWNQRPEGLHSQRFTVKGIYNSYQWCRANR